MTDWAVGDLAVCVDAADRHYSAEPGMLVEGALYSVVVVTIGAYTKQTALVVRGPAAPRSPCTADRFRKAVSDKHEPCEAEFVTLLKRTKRTVRA